MPRGSKDGDQRHVDVNIGDILVSGASTGGSLRRRHSLTSPTKRNVEPPQKLCLELITLPSVQ